MHTHSFFSCKFISLAALFLLTACVQQLPQGSEHVSGNIRLTASSPDLPSVQTRTMIGSSDFNDDISMLWDPAEELTAYSSADGFTTFKGTNTSQVSTTTFISSDATTVPEIVLYPYADGAEDPSAVPVSVPQYQVYAGPGSIAPFDYKYANEFTLQSDGSYHIAFNQMCTLIKFVINLDGVCRFKSNEVLYSINISTQSQTAYLTADEATLDLTASEPQWSIDIQSTDLTLDVSGCDAAPTSSFGAYGVVMPGKHKDDEWCVTITTADKTTLSDEENGPTIMREIYFFSKVKCDLEAGLYYILPLNPTVINAGYHYVYDDNGNESVVSGPAIDVYDDGTDVMPELLSFSFESALNEGKILSKELYYDDVKGATTYRTVSTVELEILDDEVSGCIPYLYDRNLVPTFEVSEDVDMVLVNGEEQKSGESVQDFSVPVEYTLVSGDSERTYTVSLSNTGLPVVVINHETLGYLTEEWEETGILVNSKDGDWGDNFITVYNPDGSQNLATASCGFRLRGNSSRWFPKKPFAIKLSSKANLLDIMPSGAHKRWCLLAGWTDRSMMRNAVAFNIANQTISGWKNEKQSTGLLWSPSGKHVELVLDGVHLGNYFLCEQIKIDEYRLNINPPYEDVDNPQTSNCGYLLEFDDNYDETYKFYTQSTGLPCMFKDDVTPELQAHVENKVNSADRYLSDRNYTAAFDFLDIYSVIDWWIVYELAMNNEYRHPKSVYMYINGDSKIYAGPVWDFDYQTFVNIARTNQIHSSKSQPGYIMSDYNSWLYSRPTSSEPYMWYPILFGSEDFRTAVQERWRVMKPYLEAVSSEIANIGASLELSQKYNFDIWPMDSKQRINYGWFIEYCGDELLTDWNSVISNFQTVYQNRLSAMDNSITSGNF